MIDGWTLPFALSRFRRWFDHGAGRCCQTSYGSTHINELCFAYDWVLPVGTPVLAARDGVVVASVGSFGAARRRLDPSLRTKANFVVVRHGGGMAITYSRYYHLQTSCVSVGQLVCAGERIGLSGNSGFSGGPHLHFDVTDALPTDAAWLALMLPAAAAGPGAVQRQDIILAMEIEDIGGGVTNHWEGAFDGSCDSVPLGSSVGSFSAAMPLPSAPLQAQVSRSILLYPSSPPCFSPDAVAALVAACG